MPELSIYELAYMTVIATIVAPIITPAIAIFIKSTLNLFSNKIGANKNFKELELHEKRLSILSGIISNHKSYISDGLSKSINTEVELIASKVLTMLPGKQPKSMYVFKEDVNVSQDQEKNQLSVVRAFTNKMKFRKIIYHLIPHISTAIKVGLVLYSVSGVVILSILIWALSDKGYAYIFSEYESFFQYNEVLLLFLGVVIYVVVVAVLGMLLSLIRRKTIKVDMEVYKKIKTRQ